MIDIEKLSSVVGQDNVSNEDSVLEDYSADISFTRPVKPSMVVKPQTSEQVQEIVKLAGQTLTPLIPVSSGPPHFRGDTVPGTGGGVVVDLSGMKKVIHIDRKERVAMFEPGVTFGELSAAVAEKGLRLNMPLLPRRTKSVIGSMLEREPVVMPKYHWDISDPLACTEVIFGTGDMYRTGAAAGSGTIEEQWAAGGAQKEAAGPSSASWYRMIQGSQGTMGIVTWASARCELIPSREDPYFVTSAGLDKLLDVVHWLIRLRLVNECFILNNTNLARIIGGTASSRLQQNLPQWVLFFNVVAYDFIPDERLRGQVEDTKAVLQRLGVEPPAKAVEGIGADAFLKMVQQPSGPDYWKLREKGACEDIFFLQNYDRIQEMVDTMSDLAELSGVSGRDIGVYLQPIVQGVNCHCEFNLVYDPADAAGAAAMRELSISAIRNLMSRGAYFSRPYGEATRMIVNRDAATRDSLKKVKAIADPLEIMNPGKIFV